MKYGQFLGRFEGQCGMFLFGGLDEECPNGSDCCLGAMVNTGNCLKGKGDAQGRAEQRA